MTDNYTYRIVMDVGGKIFVGTCVEFPELSFVGSDEASTLAGIKILVHDEERRSDEKVNTRNFRNWAR